MARFAFGLKGKSYKKYKAARDALKIEKKNQKRLNEVKIELEDSMRREQRDLVADRRLIQMIDEIENEMKQVDRLLEQFELYEKELVEFEKKEKSLSVSGKIRASAKMRQREASIQSHALFDEKELEKFINDIKTKLDHIENLAKRLEAESLIKLKEFRNAVAWVDDIVGTLDNIEKQLK